VKSAFTDPTAELGSERRIKQIVSLPKRGSDFYTLRSNAEGATLINLFAVEKESTAAFSVPNEIRALTDLILSRSFDRSALDRSAAQNSRPNFSAYCTQKPGRLSTRNFVFFTTFCRIIRDIKIKNADDSEKTSVKPLFSSKKMSCVCKECVKRRLRPPSESVFII